MNRLTRFVKGLQPGDAAIAGFLSLILAVSLFVSLAALLRSFQVTVPAYGGTLREGIVGSPRFANPLLAVSDSDRDLVALTYAGLMGHAEDGILVPVLAESYQVSGDGTIYTFTLREGVQFSDETPVTADDVVFTVERAQDPAFKSPEYANWANIRAEALDARTIRFTLPRAYTPFLEDATLGILPRHLWQTVRAEEFPFAPQNIMPVGAGPYVAASVVRADDGTITSYRLKAFNGYALGRPYLSRIHLFFYKDAEQLQLAYQDGDIDSTYGIARDSAQASPYARVFGVFFNETNTPAFGDSNVRKALSYAVDRTRLTEELLGGYATPIIGPLPTGSGVPSLPLPDEATRLSEARAALEEAGYTFDEIARIWTSEDGAPLTVRLTTSNVPELRAVAGQVERDWEAFGVAVELEFHDASSITQDVIRPRAYGALLFGEVIGNTPDLYAFWSSTEREHPGLNIALYTDEAVDELLVRSRTEADPALRAQVLGEIQQAIADDYPAAFLYTPDFLYNASSKIQGIELSQLSSPSDRFWGVHTWYRYAEHVWPVFVSRTDAGTLR